MKSGNGLQKTLQTIPIWRVGYYLLFLLFFCCFGCQRGEKPCGYSIFPGNGVGNGIATGYATGCDFPGFFRMESPSVL